METIVSILRAAHCKSTHHFFAIDSLWEVTTPRGMQLADMLLANYSDYLKGAKDPDTVFKDFENHVVHVADGYWGGAAKAAKKWLGNVYGLLNKGDWKESAYAIGVLSHYFMDPFMPLHTAQSPRETVLHRPLEWSVCCAYQEIHRDALANPNLEPFELPGNSEWLTDAIHGGATYAHQFYELLLNDYDMNEARRFPKVALGIDSRKVLAQLFVKVQTAWGGVLDRIASDSPAILPRVSLTLPTLLAGIQIPAKKIIQSFELAESRKEVELILEEFQRTGTVVRNVSLEQRKVHTVRKLKPDLRPAANEIERAIVAASNAVKPVESKPTAMEAIATEAIALEKSLPPSVQSPSVQPTMIESPTSDAPSSTMPTINSSGTKKDCLPTESIMLPQNDSQQFVPQRSQSTSTIKPSNLKPTSDARIDPPAKSPESSSGRTRLTMDSPIVDAPAIGPKTAARFEAIGCHSVGQFLDRNANEIVDELKVKWINVSLVKQWQDQARLSIQVDRLTAAGAGLLVSLGLCSAEQLAKQRPEQLHQQVLSIAQTNEGKRLLRDKEPPPLKTIERWIASAKSNQQQPV